ncbi:unnamed protein product [Kuraishia capsulata CBS 1993]|uniref:Uncharacterized protein n=1 Tax=Kuraishia capsulata CBS 1993 TaxID=1382522 RepID=W6MXL8_9ASCO|nr:uncharacterized protein KUCA_T00005102001 [Kuraishia capsulata CBS 1993]CDK29115.1 unnamed protein product [Kuraishia capsulata CBS 1993]
MVSVFYYMLLSHSRTENGGFYLKKMQKQRDSRTWTIPLKDSNICLD